MGYGQDIYKLALLTYRQREDMISELKIMPGHKAKLAGFFSVVDELYPRDAVVEQIKQLTPAQMPNANRKRLGPQKTIIQQYEQLDKGTKQIFNQEFLACLEQQKMGQVINQHVDLEESSNAMNEIFPPEYYGLGLNYDTAFNNEVDGLLN